MARRPRFGFTGLPQHLIQRGNNRQVVFYAEADYRFYLECLGDAARKYGCLVHAYVLMTNHAHLLATPLEPGALSRTMQHLGRRYVRYVNDVYRRTGTLWEGRFKASLVDSEHYFLRCCRYIELNPVRAQIVRVPEDYRWSSYRRHVLGMHDGLISTHEEYERLGSTAEERQIAYRELFRTELSRIELEQIRTTANQGWPIRICANAIWHLHLSSPLSFRERGGGEGWAPCIPGAHWQRAVQAGDRTSTGPGSESAEAREAGGFDNGPTCRKRRAVYLMEMVLRPLDALFDWS